MRNDRSFIELRARERAHALLDDGSYRELLDPLNEAFLIGVSISNMGFSARLLSKYLFLSDSFLKALPVLAILS